MKKIISSSFVALLIVASTNLNANIVSEEFFDADCFTVASQTEQDFLDNMANQHAIPSAEISFRVFAAAFDACYETQN
ncbi:hypothetical protein [Dokdonia sp. PRO95]|uniref:hypothetical protein n=1 Tax=Dokdonia sp. PRO95 TaxID=1239415 RepID=UPI0005582EA9|nr:hypothetical protein [Dokdonia sp. PRO95]